MPDKKLIREAAKMDVIEQIARKKKDALGDIIKTQERLESQMESFEMLDNYEKLFNNQLKDEKVIERIITSILSNEQNNKSFLCAVMCCGCDIPEYLMDRIVNDLVASKKFDMIKAILAVRDDLSEDYKEKLTSYLVANELSKKPKYKSSDDEYPF